MPESVQQALVLKWGNRIQFRTRNQIQNCVEILL
jgi:hypothetical protein